MANRSPRVRRTARRLEDILRDEDDGPDTKVGLIEKIEARTGKHCPERLFEDALHYARNYSMRRNDGYGPIIYDHFLGVYGYAGDAETFAYWYFHFNLQYSHTRLNTNYQVAHEGLLTTLAQMNMAMTPNLRDITQHAQGFITTGVFAFEQAVNQAKTLSPRGATTLELITNNGYSYVAIFTDFEEE